ncbi:hypothetical protein D0C16_05735 [Cellvibrio sp. KY-GH-1]|uniref:calcium-binding protein n=1 Tax=Cellvibrio sp. KY-GH-1 TaxID=2303332 RepID=UPI0012485D0B|nr:calcium-binding protein [Cellvibrio sp. KY-GH-1]QEY15516.1 hypothetical protein D0C16_05735 [Cellvibrio sp. KY-GH-1]
MAVTLIELLAKLISTSKAAYADMRTGSLQGSLTGGGAGFAETEAKGFVGNFGFLHQQENTNTGFSATLFSSTSGKKVLAIRGTEIPADVFNDLASADIGDIGGQGYAAKQAADLYRYWKRLTSDSGQKSLYKDTEIETLYDLMTAGDDGLDVLSRHFAIQSFKSIVNEDVGLGLVGANEVVDVTGHSLGGHLAYLFGRLFPQNAGSIVTLNAPGLFPWGDTVLNDLGFTLQGGDITSVVAEGDLIHTLGAIHPGQEVYISQEVGDSLLVDGLSANHSSVNGVDALNLLTLFAQLDTSQANNPEGVLNDFMRLSANKALDTYESMLDSLRKMLLGSGIDITPPGTKDDVFQREKFYQHIKTLKESSIFNDLKGKVSFVAADATAAKNDYGQFLALYYAAPFALQGNSVLLGQLNPNLYTAWVADQNLSAEDRLLGKANFSEEWYQDSATYLNLLLDRNKNDIDKLESSDPGGKDALYIKVENDDNDAHRIYSGSTNASNYSAQPYAPWVILGTMEDNDNATRGGNGNDRIYGLGGNDKLNGLNGNDVLDGGAGDDELLGGADTDLLLGGKDNDTLDGGAGNDVLKGGAGNDTYKFTGDFGHDTVIDTEGLNTLDINGAVGELKQTAKDSIIYRNSANTVEAVLVDSGGSKTLLLNSLSNAGSSVTLDKWSDGQFGVSLKDADAETPPSLPTISGDGGANALSADFASAYETLVYVPPVSLHGGGGHDYIEGSWGGDRIYGDGGNDWIDAGSVYKYSGTITPKAGDPTYDQHGKDLIDGGEGDDVITGRSASSSWHGGDGKDMLLANTALRFDFMFGGYRDGGDQFSRSYMSDLTDEGAGRAVTLDYKWRDLLNYADSGFEIIKKTEGDKTLYGYSAWAGITPGTYSGGSSAGNGWSYEFNFVDGEPLKPSAELGGGISSYLYKYPGMPTGDLGGVASHILQSKYTKNGQSRDWEVSLFMHELSLEGSDTLAKLANKPYIQLHGDEGDDLLVGWHGKDELYGGDDNDALFAGAGNDVLDGGSGDDTLFGEAGDDTIIGGSGNDVMVGDSGRTEVLSSNDFLYGGSGNDTLSGNEGNDYLYGGADNDLLLGESGNDYLVGSEGVDTFHGGSGADTIVAGFEDFFAAGGDDNDVYIIDATIYNGLPSVKASAPRASKQKNILGSQLYGAATISSMDAGLDAPLVIQDTGGENSLFLKGVSSFENLQVTASGSDLIIGHLGKKLIFVNGLQGGLSQIALGGEDSVNTKGIELNEFLLSNLSSPVSRWAASPGTSIVGGLEDDSLVAHDGGSTLIGGKGNDLLSGGQGDDIYVVRNGDGLDNITEQGGINTINLTEGILADQLALHRTNGNLLVLISGSQSVVVNGMFDLVTGDLVANKAIHKIQFSNGDVWDLERILQESVKGSTLTGTILNDLLIGYEGNDTLIGGRGDDTLRGDRGDDHYQFAIGDGADEIDDRHGSDHIYFDEGINETQVSLRKDTNNNLIIRINNNDSITVLNAFNATGELTRQAIEHIHFNNTSVWDLARIQSEIAKNQFHTFTGTTGNDQLLGDNASQIFNGGKGGIV